MQNIDPVAFLEPALSLAIAVGVLLYWWNSKGLRAMVLGVSCAAYFLAIGAKYAIQIPTIAAVIAAFGRVSIELGLCYGLQTAFPSRSRLSSVGLRNKKVGN